MIFIFFNLIRSLPVYLVKTPGLFVNYDPIRFVWGASDAQSGKIRRFVGDWRNSDDRKRVGSRFSEPKVKNAGRSWT